MDKPADKPVDKPADKPVDKPADKPVDKPADKPVDKSADKIAEQHALPNTGENSRVANSIVTVGYGLLAMIGLAGFFTKRKETK